MPSLRKRKAVGGLFEYKNHNYQYIKNIVAVPKNVQGITATRNWILKNTKEKWVVFLDDDEQVPVYFAIIDKPWV